MKRLIILIVFLIVLVAWFIFSTIDSERVPEQATTEQILQEPSEVGDSLN